MLRSRFLPIFIGAALVVSLVVHASSAPEQAGSMARAVLIRAVVLATVGGLPATVQYAGPAPGKATGLMQVNVRIPNGVEPGGYVPVVLQVGNASTTASAVWIAVSPD